MGVGEYLLSGFTGIVTLYSSGDFYIYFSQIHFIHLVDFLPGMNTAIFDDYFHEKLLPSHIFLYYATIDENHIRHTK